MNNDLETITLREAQEHAFQICKDEKRFGIFFSMGVGKTATILKLIDYLVFEKMEVSKILIIAPPKVVNEAQVWQNEIKKWKNFRFFDFLEINGDIEKRQKKIALNDNTISIMSDSLITWYEKQYKDLYDYDMIIIDESSRFKNPKSKRFYALEKMIGTHQRVYLLSGTPMPNGFQDLWSQMYLLDKGERLGNNYYKFIAKNVYYVNDYKFVFLKTTQKMLTDKISDICMFADSEDIELPPKEEIIVSLKWSEEKQKAFKDFKNQYVLELEGGTITTSSKAALINKLLQISNGYVYVDRELNYEFFDDTKFKWVKDFANKSNDNMLVFYSFKFDKEKLLTIAGAREIRTKSDVVAWNKGEIKVGIISPYSFQYGANLQYGGNIVIWYGMIWGLENFLQSNKRIWRFGQKKKVYIYYLLMDDTVDKLVYDRLMNKDEEEQDFLEKIKRI